jgi:phospholipid-binding lipoprotein MlaA
MSTTVRVSLAVCLLILCGCATLPPGSKRDPRDPWERLNRTTYKVNDALDKAILRPVARGYRSYTPRFAQTGIRNFLDNLNYPVVMLNDLLQWEIKAFFTDTARLFINTTVGLGGFLDPATAAGIDKNDRELGQTLGKWGVPAGPYVVIPILGASDVRDGLARIGNDFSSPRQYIKNNYWNYGLWTIDELDTRARLLDLDRLVDSAFDPYAFVRNAYLQNREFRIHGGRRTQSEEEREEQMLREAGEDEESAPSTHPPQSNPPHPPQGNPPQPQPQPPQTQPQTTQPQSNEPPPAAPPQPH